MFLHVLERLTIRLIRVAELLQALALEARERSAAVLPSPFLTAELSLPRPLLAPELYRLPL